MCDYVCMCVCMHIRVHVCVSTCVFAYTVHVYYIHDIHKRVCVMSLHSYTCVVCVQDTSLACLVRLPVLYLYYTHLYTYTHVQCYVRT